MTTIQLRILSMPLHELGMRVLMEALTITDSLTLCAAQFARQIKCAMPTSTCRETAHW